MALLRQLDPDSALSPWSPIRFRLPTAVHKSLAASDAIGTGTAEFGSVRKDKITGHADIRTHTGMRHMLCQVEADKKKQAQQVGTSAAALRGKLGKHLTFTQKDVIIGRLFTIVHALAKKHIAMNAMSDICDMVRAWI